MAQRKNRNTIISLANFVLRATNYFFIFVGLISPASALTLFSNEQAAHLHCPKDSVVWLNLKSGIWHYKGERWYGRTREGAFVCEHSAAMTGDRGTENGQ